MSDHTNLPCELLTSLLIRGMQMGEISVCELQKCAINLRL
jgi:hypothetical protein